MTTESTLSILSRRSESFAMIFRGVVWWAIAFPAAAWLYAYDMRTRWDAVDAFKVFAAWALLWMAYAEHKRANRAEARADALERILITSKLDGPAAAPAQGGEPWAEVMMNVRPGDGVDLQAERVKVTPSKLAGWLEHNAPYLHGDSAKRMLAEIGDTPGFDQIRGRLLNLARKK